MKKIFILDATIALYDDQCLFNFQENDIYISIGIFEELEKFRTGIEQININARKFIQTLDEISDDNLFTEGALLGEGLGRLFVVAGNVASPQVQESFPIRKPEHITLGLVEYLTQKYPQMRTILVSKNVNIRMKARSLGFCTEDYYKDTGANFDYNNLIAETMKRTSTYFTDKRYQVFVSSTYEDLQVERQRVMEVLLQKNCFPVGMELFPAANDDQWTVIQSLLKECDYYILIIGGRYGSIDVNTGISYTQKEYQYAQDLGIPTIVFVPGDPNKIIAEKTEFNKSKRKKLNDFKALVEKSRLRDTWSTPENLALKVSTSLDRLILTHPRAGWVRTNTLLGLVVEDNVR